MFTTAKSEIWVELLVTSLRKPGWNTQDNFDWASRAVRTFLGYLWFPFYINCFRSLATIWTAAMFSIFFHFEARVVGRDCRVVYLNTLTALKEFYVITKPMRALWLVSQLWVIVPVNPRKNRSSFQLLYKSNRPQVSMGYIEDITRWLEDMN